jgi:hypothetical protein
VQGGAKFILEVQFAKMAAVTLAPMRPNLKAPATEMVHACLHRRFHVLRLRATQIVARTFAVPMPIVPLLTFAAAVRAERKATDSIAVRPRSAAVALVLKVFVALPLVQKVVSRAPCPAKKEVVPQCRAAQLIPVAVANPPAHKVVGPMARATVQDRVGCFRTPLSANKRFVAKDNRNQLRTVPERVFAS